MEVKEFTVTVKLTREDIMQMNLSYLARQGYIWIFAVLFILATTRIAVDFAAREFSGYTPMAIFVFIMMIVLIYSLLSGSKKSFESKFVQEERRYTFSENDIYMESESTTQRLLWSDLVRALTLPKFVVLFLAHNSVHLIPTRAMSPEQVQAIKQAIKDKVRKDKKSGLRRFLIRTAIYLVVFLVTVGIVQYFLAE
ncbi:YcxB family protein [Cohnella suwonensis]|uniref:YcxB family protein n=1 Tax=Cohnella suwonensis TaxID=696072 RepID=A0ABW0M293_9BACL